MRYITLKALIEIDDKLLKTYTSKIPVEDFDTLCGREEVFIKLFTRMGKAFWIAFKNNIFGEGEVEPK